MDQAAYVLHPLRATLLPAEANREESGGGRGAELGSCTQELRIDGIVCMRNVYLTIRARICVCNVYTLRMHARI